MGTRTICERSRQHSWGAADAVEAVESCTRPQWRTATGAGAGSGGRRYCVDDPGTGRQPSPLAAERVDEILRDLRERLVAIHAAEVDALEVTARAIGR